MLLANSAFIMAAGGNDIVFPEVSPTPIAVQATGVNDAICSKPIGTVSSDLLISFAMAVVSSTWTQPTGFTEAFQGSNTQLAHKIAGGSEPSTYTPSLSSSGGKVATILRIPRAVYDTVGALSALGGAPAAPSITMSRPGLLLAFFWRESSSAALTYSVPAGMELVFEKTDPFAVLAIFAQEVGTGATGTRTSTASAGSDHRGILLGVVPT